MRYYKLLGIICLMIMMWINTDAQDRTGLMPAFAPITPLTGTSCDEEIERRLWDGINEFRRRNNLLPLAFNMHLCQVAQDHVYDLAARQPNSIGNQYQREDGSFLDNWLTDEGYQPYFGSDFVAAMRPWVVADIAPETQGSVPGVLEYLYGGFIHEPLYNLTLSSNYREIGIAYHQSETRYFYVFVFGSQPNIFPVIPVNPNYVFGQRYEYAYEWNMPEVGLLIHNERFSPTGRPPQLMGTVTALYTSSVANNLVSCPQPRTALPDSWFRFPLTQTSPLPYSVSGGLGQNTIYIHMCDANGSSSVNSVTIHYNGETPLRPETETVAAAPAISDAEITAVAESLAMATQTTEAQSLADVQSQNLVSTQVALVASSTAISQKQANVAATTTAIHATETRLAETAIIANNPSDDATSTQNAVTIQAVQATQTELPLAVQRIAARQTEIFFTQTAPLDVTPTPSITPTPTVTITPSGELPFAEIQFYWHQPFLVMYNPGPFAISFDVIRRLTFRDSASGRTYSGASAVAFSDATELDVQRCIAVEDVNDGLATNAQDVQNFFGGCDIEFGLASQDAVERSALIWSYGSTSFEIYYDDRLLTTCPSSVFQCSIP